jgi:hypothetical protein
MKKKRPPFMLQPWGNPGTDVNRTVNHKMYKEKEKAT